MKLLLRDLGSITYLLYAFTLVVFFSAASSIFFWETEARIWNLIKAYEQRTFSPSPIRIRFLSVAHIDILINTGFVGIVAYIRCVCSMERLIFRGWCRNDNDGKVNKLRFPCSVWRYNLSLLSCFDCIVAASFALCRSDFFCANFFFMQRKKP